MCVAIEASQLHRLHIGGVGQWCCICMHPHACIASIPLFSPSSDPKPVPHEWLSIICTNKLDIYLLHRLYKMKYFPSPKKINFFTEAINIWNIYYHVQCPIFRRVCTHEVYASLILYYKWIVKKTFRSNFVYIYVSSVKNERNPTNTTINVK